MNTMKEIDRASRGFKKHHRKASFWCRLGIAANKRDGKLANKIAAIATDRSTTEATVMDAYLKRYLYLVQRDL